MTEPGLTRTAPNLIGVGAQSIAENASRLGLTWGLRPATVTTVTSPTLVQVRQDGDTENVFVVSLIGGVAVGDRVMTITVPPAGIYIVGLLPSASGRAACYCYLETISYAADDVFVPTDYPGLRGAFVKLVGSGGAGGGSAATGVNGVSAGAGGGSGGYAEGFVTVAAMGASVTVTVGAGGVGASGATGGAGNATSFGAFVAASGGAGGTVATTAAAAPVQTSPTAAGSGTAGDRLYAGGPGEASLVYGVAGTASGRSGNGGDSALGGGARGNNVSSNGATAGLYGGGGSGATNLVSQSARAGGNGGVGVVIMDLYA